MGRFDGGEVTTEELRREVTRLPPVLRARFETANGRREMVGALVDKRLLRDEGMRRKLHLDPEIVRQVQELEERLVVQALLAAEEKAAGAPSDAELRAFHDAHRAELAQPDRVRVRRILAAAARGAASGDRARARARAEAFAARLSRGEPFEKVAAAGDGPEKASAGDLGLLVAGEGKDRRLEAAALALRSPGARSGVIECADGYAVLELVERRPGRVPELEEVRGEVENRLAAQRKRKAFEDLLARLRADADVRIELAAGNRTP